MPSSRSFLYARKINLDKPSQADVGICFFLRRFHHHQPQHPYHIHCRVPIFMSLRSTVNAHPRTTSTTNTYLAYSTQLSMDGIEFQDSNGTKVWTHVPRTGDTYGHQVRVYSSTCLSYTFPICSLPALSSYDHQHLLRCIYRLWTLLFAGSP